MTSLANVRAFLQKNAPDTGQDTIISSLITRASSVIQRYSEREFAPASSAVARKFRVNGARRVDLRPYDLRTPTLVRLDTDGTSPSTVASTDYRLEPLPTRDGVYSWLTFSTLTWSSWSTSGFSEREVEITGDWGFASVPQDVEHACIVTVADWLKRDVSAFTTFFNTESGRVELSRIIPEEAKIIVDLYRRPLVA